MNDTDTKPRYIPEESGNPLPNLGRHGSHNEAPVPLNRPRSVPSRAMSDSPQKYLLPAGAELRDVIRRRLTAQPMSAPALWASLNYAYQTRPRQEQSLIDAVAGMVADGEIEQRDGTLHVAEPEPVVAEIPEKMWTMTHTERVAHVLTDEPQTRAALAQATGLTPRQVSKAVYLLIQRGDAEIVGEVPRTWRRKDTMAEAEPTKQPTKPKMDADEVCKSVLESLGDKVRPEAMIVSDIVALTDWPVDEAKSLLDDMLACGYVVKQDGGRIGQPAKLEAEPIMLTEAQTRDVALERASSACPGGVLVEDVARLSGWKRDTVAALLETMLRDGELTRFDDERIGLPVEVKSEDPPAYEIGDDDDGEIPEPGVARPQTDPVFAQWVVFDGAGWTRADSEQDARRIAEGRAYGGHESAVYRRVAVCRMRPEWDDANE